MLNELNLNKLDSFPTPNINNLKGSADRREYIREEFAKYGINDIRIMQYDHYDCFTGPTENLAGFTGNQDIIAQLPKGATSSQLLTIKWWLENTDEEVGSFFEDDVDLSTIENWNFTYREFVERIERSGNEWDALQLCLIFEFPYDRQNTYPPLIPRYRNKYDHGLQCFVLKREYAKRLIDYYFCDPREKNNIVIRQRNTIQPSIENLILSGFGTVITFPLFNHNIHRFDSTIDKRNDGYILGSDETQVPCAFHSYKHINYWWESIASNMSLEQIFNNDTENCKNYTPIKEIKMINKFDIESVPNIINLKEHTDRSEYMKNEFLKMNISNITIHEFERYENQSLITVLGKEEIMSKIPLGVLSSHLLAIKRWLENTDEPIGIFFEDDTCFKPMEHWNFTLSEFIERFGDDVDALHLCNVIEFPFDDHNKVPAMIPRYRATYDHGLQCYVLKREYAQKVVDFYFINDDYIHLRMNDAATFSVENNVLCGFGRVVTFPLFNHNVKDFDTINTIHGIAKQNPFAGYSYCYIDNWWKEKGSQLNLEQIFNNEREKEKIYMRYL